MKLSGLARTALAGWLLAIIPLGHGASVSRPSPAAPGALGSSLTLALDGAPWLSWLEPAGPGAWAMKVSRYAATAKAWGPASRVVQGEDLFVNWADFPQLAVGTDGRLTAVWFVNNPAHHAVPGSHHGAGYRAIYRHSADGGRTWGPDLPVSDEALPVEFVALQPLPGGRVLAAWLDGRAHDPSALYARVLDGPGPDVRVDASVCDCCQLALVPLKNGGALLAYRGRTPDEVRDIRIVRFDGKAWGRPVPLHADNWKIAGCPVNGPQLAADGDRLGAVWFTAADNQPRVLARRSADAGETFGPVVRVDLGRPQGRVDAVMLPDGTLVLSWLELTGKADAREGGIYLRALSPAGVLSDPVLAAATATSRLSGFPRMVPLSPRQVLLTCTQEGEPTRVLTLVVDVP